VTTEPSLVELLFRQGRLAGAARYAFRAREQERGIRRLRAGAGRLWRGRLAFLPPTAHQWVRDRRFRRTWLTREMPPWFGPRLRRLWPGRLPDRDQTQRVWRDPRQGRLWEQLTDPRASCVVDYLDMGAARYGMESRLPFYDQTLVDLMLSLPEEALVGLDERRGIHKRAMTGLLPWSVIQRQQGVAFTSSHVHNAARVFPWLREVLLEDRWISGDYIDQKAARLLLDRLDPLHPADSQWLDWTALRDIVCLEIWMRRF